LIARETLLYFWKQLQTSELFKQLAVEKQITAEKIQQASISTSSGGSGFLNTLFSIGSSIFGGGGGWSRCSVMVQKVVLLLLVCQW
jgi:hypothetical protein